MPNKNQIKLIQMAARAAGLRTKQSGQRYYFMLAQYKRPDGSAVTSCKQLNNSQIEDFLAICESLGWQYPGRADDFYRQKVNQRTDVASFAQQSAIVKLRGDLGWGDAQLRGMIKRITKDRTDSVAVLSPKEAHATIEALKNILGRETGKKYSNLKDVQKDMEVAADGKEQEGKITAGV